MTYEEAKLTLLPDTMLFALAEYAYYGSGNGRDAKIKAVEEAYIKACEAIDKVLASQWVPSNRLPEEKCIAACFAEGRYGYGEMIIGYVAKEGDVVVAENNDEYLCHVTHWMPLPEPPKEV